MGEGEKGKGKTKGSPHGRNGCMVERLGPNPYSLQPP